MRHEEWHVTVTGDPFQWRQFCLAAGIKPLWIELNNFERQLMCASTHDPQEIIRAAGWNIVRIKHEVECPPEIDVTTHEDKVKHIIYPDVEGAIYYECHVKFDGRFQPQFRMTSRDLFRENRWYATRRSERPFDPKKFADLIHTVNGERSHRDSWEYEACLADTNPGLDARWN